MDRRSFVRQSAFGAVGIGFVNKELRSLAENPAHPDAWLRRLAALIQARSLTAGRVFSGKSAELYTQTNAWFAARGYWREGTRVFAGNAGQADCIFYPLYLRHAKAGITDVVTPVFLRGSGGDWQHAATLSGFQLEALCHAAAEMPELDLPAGALLFPAALAPSKVWSEGRYATKAGTVEIITRLEPGRAVSTISIASGRKELYSGSFVSRHMLTGSKTAV